MRLNIISIVLLFSQIMFAQDQFLIAGTYTKGDSEGIYVFKFNSVTGEMEKVSAVVTKNPSYIAVSKDKKYIYTVNEDGKGKGAVSSFSFNRSTGKLTFINQQPSHGDHPCYISVDNSNKWVVAGNYSGGNFAVYPLQDNGSLGEAVQIIQHSGTSVNKSRQEKPHVHAVVFTPDGRYLAVSDLGIDKNVLYRFDASAKKPVDESPIETDAKPGTGPRHIIFHNQLPFAYVIEELSGTVASYRVNNGKLESIQTISSHPENYKGSIGSAAIRISGDGKFLYASNRGESNTIAIYSIDGLNGTITLKGIVSSGGKTPRDFNIDPSDKFLLSANSGSDNIIIFRRNSKTGIPEDIGKQVSIPQPVCIVFL